MKTNLKKLLLASDEVDFRELYHSLHIADLVKETCKRLDIAYEQFAERLGVNQEEFVTIIKGCYPFDLRIMSKIDAVREAFEIEHMKENFKGIISCPPYKYSVERSSEVKSETDSEHTKP